MSKKKRSESFFGMHFDFHAHRDQTGIGDNCSPDAIGKMLDAVRPDYVQCDTKGHNGATSYPTKAGNPAKGITADILAMWREETAKRDISLYAHHSGVWDSLAIERNPDWAAVNESGEPSKEKTSVFGPYARKLLIPQLIEMAEDYGLDGVWIDGDCWAVMPDYSPWAQKAWEEETGRPLPKSGEAGYDEFLEFNRRGFREYVRSYVRGVKEAAPEFEVASNWFYTTFAPEAPEVPVDFISGDYSPQNSVNTARLEAPCLVHQGKPWDLMAWGFNIQNGFHCIKTAKQLCQEAAVVLSCGGGFQFYNAQLVGTVQEWAVPVWEEVAAFCRDREEICHRAMPVPEVALIYSTKAFYAGKQNLFTPYGCPVTRSLKGMLFSVYDNQYSADVLMTHHVGESLSDYGLVILPNVSAIEDGLREQLLAYADAGGVLVVSGADSIALFETELGIEAGEKTDEELIQVYSGGAYAPAKQKLRKIKPVTATETASGFLGSGVTDPEKRVTLAVESSFGAGKLVGVCFDLGSAYEQGPSEVLRGFAASLLAEYKNPKVRVRGSRYVQVALMEKDGRTNINLLNLAGPHAEERQRSFGEIPPLCGLTVEYRCPSPPGSVRLFPGGAPLPYEYSDGLAKIKLDVLGIHCVVSVEL